MGVTATQWTNLAGNESRADPHLRRDNHVARAFVSQFSTAGYIVKKSSYLARVSLIFYPLTWKTPKLNRRVFVKIGKSYACYVRVRRARRWDYSFSSVSWLSAPSRVDSCSSTSGSSMFCPERLNALRCTWIIRAIRPHAVAHIPPKIA